MHTQSPFISDSSCMSILYIICIYSVICKYLVQPCRAYTQSTQMEEKTLSMSIHYILHAAYMRSYSALYAYTHYTMLCNYFKRPHSDITSIHPFNRITLTTYRTIWHTICAPCVYAQVDSLQFHVCGTYIVHLCTACIV